MPKGQQRRFTDFESTIIRDMWATQKRSEIARKLCRSTGTIFNHATTVLGLDPNVRPPGNWSEEDDIRLIELWPDHTLEQVHKIMGKGRETVRRAAIRNNLPAKGIAHAKSVLVAEVVVPAKQRAKIAPLLARPSWFTDTEQLMGRMTAGR